MQTLDLKFSAVERVALDSRHVDMGPSPFETQAVELEIDYAIRNFSNVWISTIGYPTPFPIGRFSPGHWPVLYTALEFETAVSEVVWHLLAKYGLIKNNGETLIFPLIRYQLKFSGTVCDLVANDFDVSDLVSQDYARCHEIADSVRTKACAALAPSARRVGGKCLPVFNKDSVGHPEIAFSVRANIVKGEKNVQILCRGVRFETSITSTS